MFFNVILTATPGGYIPEQAIHLLVEMASMVAPKQDSLPHHAVPSAALARFAANAALLADVPDHSQTVDDFYCLENFCERCWW